MLRSAFQSHAPSLSLSDAASSSSTSSSSSRPHTPTTPTSSRILRPGGSGGFVPTPKSNRPVSRLVYEEAADQMQRPPSSSSRHIPVRRPLVESTDQTSSTPAITRTSGLPPSSLFGKQIQSASTTQQRSHTLPLPSSSIQAPTPSRHVHSSSSSISETPLQLAQTPNLASRIRSRITPAAQLKKKPPTFRAGSSIPAKQEGWIGGGRREEEGCDERDLLERRVQEEIRSEEQEKMDFFESGLLDKPTEAGSKGKEENIKVSIRCVICVLPSFRSCCRLIFLAINRRIRPGTTNEQSALEHSETTLKIRESGSGRKGKDEWAFGWLSICIIDLASLIANCRFR